MITWLNKWWRVWTGVEELATCVTLLREHNGALAAENRRLRSVGEATENEATRLTEELAEAQLWRAAGKFANAYFAGMPKRSAEDIAFTQDDRRDLATWAGSPAGAKLLQQLANRLADYEVAAIRVAAPSAAFALCARARGFRDAVAEVKAFTAAGPSPANHEAPDFPLPEGLEHLMG